MRDGVTMPNIDIYTTYACPYCARAKQLLRAKNATFNEIDVSDDHAQRQSMTLRANGRRTVPQIFIGATHVGGSDDLHALEAQGKLDTLLAA
jgi:glutaredoxin 3